MYQTKRKGPRQKVAGPEGWRDEETRARQREEAYRRHVLEGESLRSIAVDLDLAVATVQNDVAEYQRLLRSELPKTFEQWQMRVWAEYQALKDEAEALYDESKPGSLVRMQALRLKFDLAAKVEALFGVNKGVKAPIYGEEDAPTEIEWVHSKPPRAKK